MADETRGGPGDGAGAVPPARVGATVWRRATGTAYVESAERAVVLDLDHLDLPPYVFEGSAARIWAALDGERTETEVVTELAEAFDAPVDRIARDVEEFVDRLRDLGLVVAGTDG